MAIRKLAEGAQMGLPGVIITRGKDICVRHRYNNGYGYNAIPWNPPPGYDKRMKKVVCLHCGRLAYITPKARPRRVRR